LKVILEGKIRIHRTEATVDENRLVINVGIKTLIYGSNHDKQIKNACFRSNSFSVQLIKEANMIVKAVKNSE
jgi:hypothetical protein